MVLLFVQLDLSDNDIGGYLDEAMLIYTPEGSEAIAKALRASASLTSVNLSLNKLGPEGAQHIGKGIAVSASLTQVLAFYKLSPSLSHPLTAVVLLLA